MSNGSYSIETTATVERGRKCDATTIVSSGNDVVDLHAGISDHYGRPEVLLQAAVGDVNIYLRVSLADAAWLAQQITRVAQGALMPGEVEFA